MELRVTFVASFVSYGYAKIYSNFHSTYISPFLLYRCLFIPQKFTLTSF